VLSFRAGVVILRSGATKDLAKIMPRGAEAFEHAMPRVAKYLPGYTGRFLATLGTTATDVASAVGADTLTAGYLGLCSSTIRVCCPTVTVSYR
jgi:hypothetical protein